MLKLSLKLITLLLAAMLTACMGTSDTQNTYRHDEPAKPDFHQAALLNVEMGEGYLAQGQIARAKGKFIHALELEPRLPEAHSSFGYFYETVSDLKEAESHYKKAITYAANKGRFYNNYGTFLCRQGRFAEADKAFNHAIEDKKYVSTAEVYENAGVCAIKQPDLAKATGYLETAIRRDPNRANPYYELAKLELKRGQLKAAKFYIDSYHSIQKPQAKSLALSIEIKTKLGEKDAVHAESKLLREKFPDKRGS